MERRTLILALLTGGLALSGLAHRAHAEDSLEAMGGLRPAAPSPAPDVAFTTLDGHEVRVRELRGKPVFLGFFTTW